MWQCAEIDGQTMECHVKPSLGPVGGDTGITGITGMALVLESARQVGTGKTLKSKRGFSKRGFGIRNEQTSHIPSTFLAFSHYIPPSSLRLPQREPASTCNLYHPVSVFLVTIVIVALLFTVAIVALPMVVATSSA
ncbi:hypothetical protein B0H11DRAFT_2199514 [Mycena galericulata]|nr:hypothetical protein B0H11DRAFT_2199514 [Mycena galericulata]